MVGLYSEPANTRAGNAVGMAAANGSRQERSHVGNLKCKRSWECVACPPQALPEQAGWLVLVGLITGMGGRAGSLGSSGLGEGLSRGGAQQRRLSAMWFEYRTVTEIRDPTDLHPSQLCRQKSGVWILKMLF